MQNRQRCDDSKEDTPGILLRERARVPGLNLPLSELDRGRTPRSHLQGGRGRGHRGGGRRQARGPRRSGRGWGRGPRRSGRGRGRGRRGHCRGGHLHLCGGGGGGLGLVEELSVGLCDASRQPLALCKGRHLASRSASRLR